MKQITKVLAISINGDDLRDISRSFEKMFAKTDFQKMVDAINILDTERDAKVTVDELKVEIRKCYLEVMNSMGPVNNDGFIDIDLLSYHSVGSDSSLGFILKLKFNADKEYWIWTLNLEVASNYVYPVLVYDTEFINGRADAAAAEFETRRLDGMTVNQAQECAIKVLTQGL